MKDRFWLEHTLRQQSEEQTEVKVGEGRSITVQIANTCDNPGEPSGLGSVGLTDKKARNDEPGYILETEPTGLPRLEK